MNNDTNRDTDKQADLSKSQTAQQPQDKADQARSDRLDQNSVDQPGEPTEGAATMADYGSAEQADAMTQNRSDVEGSSLDADTSKGQSGGFVGSDSQSDTSSELIDDDQSKAPEGK